MPGPFRFRLRTALSEAKGFRVNSAKHLPFLAEDNEADSSLRSE
jgi:hypothetical protein